MTIEERFEARNGYILVNSGYETITKSGIYVPDPEKDKKSFRRDYAYKVVSIPEELSENAKIKKGDWVFLNWEFSPQLIPFGNDFYFVVTINQIIGIAPNGFDKEAAIEEEKEKEAKKKQQAEDRKAAIRSGSMVIIPN